MGHSTSVQAQLRGEKNCGCELRTVDCKRKNTLILSLFEPKNASVFKNALVSCYSLIVPVDISQKKLTQ